MAKTTTNKSLRLDEPIKTMRREPITRGEIDDSNRVAGASGQRSHRRRRPGRAAALRSAGARTRSQRWRSAGTGDRTKRRGNLAKGSHTGGARGPRR
jgi:hypothetical protein